MPPRPTAFGPATRRSFGTRPGNAAPPAIHRVLFAPVPAEVAEDDPLRRDDRLARLEAALWLADEPLASRKLAEAAGLADGHEARRLIDRLRHLYDAADAPFQVEELAGGYQLLTRPAYHPWLARLRRTGRDARLPGPALETLAAVAYRQPITRADLEAIRGVSCADAVRLLLERGLIRVTGRHPSLGRPQLYGTTKRFLQAFGLTALADLPEVAALTPPA